MADWTPPSSDVEADWTAPSHESDTPYQPGVIMSALKNIQHAATFGQDDRFNAAISGLTGKEPFGQGYDAALKKNQEYQRQTEANPWVAGAGQLVGNLIPGVPLMKATDKIAKGVGGIAATIGRSGLAGAIQGGAAGAGEAATPSEVLPNAVRGANFGAAAGAALPAVGGLLGKATSIPYIGPKISDFLKNYENLQPTVTGKMGPATIGFGSGAVAGNTAGVAGIPGGIKPEDWTSDPLSAAGNTLKWGIGGAAGGKLLQTLGRAGGAAQATMRGNPLGPITGMPNTPSGPNTPPMPPSGNEPAPRLKLPGDMDVNQPGVTDNAVVQRQTAMAQQTTPEGRAATNDTAPLAEEGQSPVIEDITSILQRFVQQHRPS